MAFTVTPTSGAGPYSLSAQIENAINIDGVNYVATAGNSDAVGSCPVSGTGSMLNPSTLARLLNGETVVSGAPSVAAGSCRTYTLTIKRVSDDAIIGTENAQVDNL